MATKRRTTSKQSGGPSKQGGGTFVGIVLGLIVGLAIAVIVALYITRSPTPFVAKLTGGGASDATAASDVDLNRSLQGKSPGQAVPGAQQPPAQPQAGNAGANVEPQIIEVPSSAPAAQAQPPKVVPGTNQQAEAPAPAPAAPAPAPAPKPAQNANNTASTPPAAANSNSSSNANSAANDANSGYLLQVGAYKTEGDAEQQRARLAFQGFESKVTRRDAAGVTYFRVRVGPYSKFADMNAARQRLADAGIDTVVIRFQKDTQQ